MDRIGSKTNSSLKLQTSNSFLYLDLGRLRRADWDLEKITTHVQLLTGNEVMKLKEI